MAKEGNCLFRIGYFLYSRTSVGKFYHRRDIAKARAKYPDGETHSVIQPKSFNDLTITPLPILLDNYAYIVTCGKTGTSIVVDPGDAEPVIKYLKEQDITPAAVLVTHKHWDHAGGNADFKKEFSGIKVFGGKHDNVPDVTNTVDQGHSLEFGSLKFSVQFTPGHTVGHVVYILDGGPYGAPDSLFSGDHLFLGGCGRMFEGPPSTMLGSLDDICQLSGETLVWPGHEYANDNMEFACHLEPDNTAAQDKNDWIKQQREKRLVTCPSTIGDEKMYNPFLRTSIESVLKSLGVTWTGPFQPPTDNVRAQALAEVRRQKDTLKYNL
ncbi:probable hydrolase PNKD [Mizuhopecten yessoensis]|uniref:Hydrolase PNKD n=1 Tax=Mizuhopecten yessoensis TaxID=6573 RepID=A0A210Q1L9_MIZYE|nr:probable hydrolase PNKD [Mizuhopecten yessoensis]OWF42569.1 hydrolase PNKD [Mizuhopecten yessoensis]